MNVEGIPWNANPKGELRYKHLANGVQLFMHFLGPTYHLCKYPIQGPYKFFKGKGVHNSHYKVHYGHRLGEGTIHY